MNFWILDLVIILAALIILANPGHVDPKPKQATALLIAWAILRVVWGTAFKF
ncbi:MAG: hypothetical protein KatS3mg015_2747 [Fimbriimonadales bacterium]|nr:MAG: hypothetical protein KatS3mg015_2747 [Fimbriimonadales bacterium]